MQCELILLNVIEVDGGLGWHVAKVGNFRDKLIVSL